MSLDVQELAQAALQYDFVQSFQERTPSHPARPTRNCIASVLPCVLSLSWARLQLPQGATQPDPAKSRR
eukprot:3025901-Alexandrium_andersonii.AAC.1